MDKGELSYEEIVTFIMSAPANIFFKDTECKYRFISEVCNLVNGGKENSIIGKTDLEIHKNKELGRSYYEDDKRILATGKGSECISEIPTESGNLYMEIKKNPVFHNGEIIGITGVITDITERVLLEKRLEELSFRDKLTGLYNRNYMEVKSKKYAGKDDFPTSLIMADCNYLKQANDTLGHEYGDVMLKRVAKAIEESVPENCITMRVGGDEFLVLCPKCTSVMAEKLISKIQQKFASKSDDILVLDAAFGYYTAENADLPFEEAFRLADQDMYKNKKKMHRES